MIPTQDVNKSMVAGLNIEKLQAAAEVVQTKTLYAGEPGGFAKQPSKILAKEPKPYNQPHQKLIIEAGGTNTRVTVERLNEALN